MLASENEIKGLLVEKETLRHKVIEFERMCVKLETERKDMVSEKKNNQANQVKLAELVRSLCMNYSYIVASVHFDQNSGFRKNSFSTVKRIQNCQREAHGKAGCY